MLRARRWLVVDRIRRSLILQNELTRYQCAFLRTNRADALLYRTQLMFHRRPRFARQRTKFRNRCLETGRSRWVLRQWRLSRFTFRTSAEHGKLIHVARAQW